MRRKLAALITVLTCFMLVFTACDPVNGTNLNHVMKASLSQTSYEGNVTIDVELLPGEDAGGAALLLGMPNIELDFYEIKQEDLNTASIKGNLIIAETKIPVAMSVTSEQFVLQVEGIQRPLVMDYSATFEELGLELGLEQLNQFNIDFATALTDYIVPNLPNPNTIEVSNTSIEVNGQSQNVRQIHAVIGGDEILELLTKLLQQLAEDEEGLREFLSSLYDLVLPIIDAVIDQTEADLGDDPSIALIRTYLDNKALVTEFLYSTIAFGYEKGLEVLESDEVKQAYAAAGMLDESYVAVDMYLDNNLHIVRSDVELAILPGESEAAADFGGVVIKVSSENWNINKPVQAELLNGENGIDLESYYVGEEILAAIDGDSNLGQLLSAFGLNEHKSYIWVDEGYAYIEDGIAFMSAYELSSQLGVELEWHTLYEDEVVFRDAITQTTVKMPKGEPVIIINGQSHDIERGAFEDEYDVYVPVRALAEAFGFEVSWDPVFRTIDLTRAYF